MIDLFISDIHIGSKRFHNPDGLYAIFKNGYNNRYILGDLIDTYDLKWKVIYEKNKEIIKAIDSFSPTIVLGNHDPNISIMKQIFPHSTIYKEELILYINGKYTILSHGHKYHMWCYIYHYISGLFRNRSYMKDWIQTIHEKHAYNQFKKNILGIDEKRTIRNYIGIYDRIIMGHTHTPKIINTPHIEYINTGSWIYKPSYIECEDGNFKLIWV